MLKQMSQKGSKLIAFFCILSLLAGTLGGCRKGDGTQDASTEPQKGRYVETQEELPGEWDDYSIRQLLRVEEQLHVLLSRDDGGQTVLQEWERSEDGSYAEVTGDWLANLRFPYTEWGELKLMQDTSGVQYLYACYSDGENYQAHLWRGENGQALEITPEKWSKPDEEYGFYLYAHDVGALDNGTIMAYSIMWSMDRFLAEDGSLLESRDLDSYYSENICTAGNKLYLIAKDQVENVAGVEIWDFDGSGGQAPGAAENVPFSQEQSGSVYLDVLPDGTMIIGDRDGFFKCEAGDTNWQKLANGSDTAFALVSSWCLGITALSDGSIYALFNDDSGSKKLMRYHYDPNAVIPVTETLTVYTVMESSLLQQAAALYHMEHPEVAVVIESAFSKMESYGGNLDYQQVYQDLNTRMTAGNAADILVLDHLNGDTYASKGLLVDIDDIVSPLEQDGSLLSNVTGAYVREGGSRYQVPLQFSMMLAVGRDLTEDDMESLESLAGALSGKTENYLGEQTIPELVDKFYPYFAGSIVNGKSLDREALAHVLENLKQIADNCGIVEKHPDNGRRYNMWDLPSTTKLAFEEIGGFNDAMFPLSIADYIKGNYTCFGQAFHPALQAGIYSKSGNQDTAKDFLRFLLSEQVQGRDYYEGFPVNAASLETLAAADRSKYAAEAMIDIGDGMTEVFTIAAFGEKDAQKLKGLCKTVYVMAKEDDKIREELTAALPGYLDGSSTLEETLDKIEGGLKMYLAE